MFVVEKCCGGPRAPNPFLYLFQVILSPKRVSSRKGVDEEMGERRHTAAATAVLRTASTLLTYQVSLELLVLRRTMHTQTKTAAVRCSSDSRVFIYMKLVVDT